MATKKPVKKNTTVAKAATKKTVANASMKKPVAKKVVSEKKAPAKKCAGKRK